MSSDPGAGNLFDRLKNRLSGEKKEKSKDHLEKEIINLHDNHKIDDTEFSMLEGILDFQGKTAREVMVPRTDAFMVDADVSFQDNLNEILREPYSRIPVYKKDKDKIKELGDQKLVAEIEKLQNQISLEQNLDQNTLDLSDDNYVQNKILKAKYTFLYNEARYRGTRFSGITNAITQ